MAKGKETEALAKAGPTEMARPAFLQDEPVEGFEGMTARDMTVPRISVAQSMSKAAKKINANYISGLEEGMFYNSMSKKIYGDFVDFIPLMFFKNRIMFKDMNAGGGVLCMGQQVEGGYACRLNHGGECLHGGFGPKGEKPECTEFFNYPSIITEADGSIKDLDLAVLSFKSTQQKKAKELNSRMRLLKASMFAQRWRVRAVPDKKDQFDFYNVEFDFLGYVESKELVEILRGQFKFARDGFASGAMQVDAEGAEEDTNFNHGANAIDTTAVRSEM